MSEKDPIIICGGKPIPHTPTVKMRAALSAKVFRANGEVEDMGVVGIKNVTSAFVTALCYALANAKYINDYKYHHSGTGTTAESNSQISLVTPVGSVVAGSPNTASGYTYTTVGTITYGGSYAITEHAVFNDAAGGAPSGAGTMMDRTKLSSVINVNSGDSIQFTYVLTINPEANPA